MVERAIEAQNLNKVIGRRPIIRDLNFYVNRGEVYALVGPNGAGKTTVIRLVSGLAFPTSGEVRILGLNPQKDPQVRHRLGAVVEAPAAFYPYLTGRENLRLHGKLAGGVSEQRIGEVLELMEINYAGNRKVGVYSLGMRQRLGVAAAVLMKPEVLILDEPASGMDPLSLHLVHRVLKEAAQEGTAVLLSTHHLDEVVTYCSRVAILEEGLLIDEVNLHDRGDRFRVRVSDVKAATATLKAQPFIQHATPQGQDVSFILADVASLGKVAGVLSRADIEVFEMTRDVFDLRAYYAERISDKRTTVAAGPRKARGERT